MDSQTKSSLAVDETVAALKGVPTREALHEMLSKDTYAITFDKMNGDERTMTCTLMPTFLPEATKKDTLSETKVRNLEDKVFVVWSLEVGGWRSFRYDRIKAVTLAPLPPECGPKGGRYE